MNPVLIVCSYVSTFCAGAITAIMHIRRAQRAVGVNDGT